MSDTDYSNHPGQIIWKQISVMTKMSCGARNPILLTKGTPGIHFKVGGKPMRYVEVLLNEDDTYTVRHFRVKRNDYSQIDLEKHEGIYVDALNETIYHAVNK
jgi:hypothetical protein